MGSFKVKRDEEPISIKVPDFHFKKLPHPLGVFVSTNLLIVNVQRWMASKDQNTTGEYKISDVLFSEFIPFIWNPHKNPPSGFT